MNVMIGLLRGVNLGGRRKIAMDVLRTLCESLKFCDAQTYVQSGNVIFRTKQQDPALVGKKLASAIERKFGFQTDVIMRTPSDLRDLIARNPFAKQQGIEPSKLLVTFIPKELAAEVQTAVLAIKSHPETMHLRGRELYVYYPDGQARSRMWAVLDKALQKSGTARNWNTVLKLLEMAEKLEAME